MILILAQTLCVGMQNQRGMRKGDSGEWKVGGGNWRELLDAPAPPPAPHHEVDEFAIQLLPDMNAPAQPFWNMDCGSLGLSLSSYSASDSSPSRLLNYAQVFPLLRKASLFAAPPPSSRPPRPSGNSGPFTAPPSRGNSHPETAGRYRVADLPELPVEKILNYLYEAETVLCTILVRTSPSCCLLFCCLLFCYHTIHNTIFRCPNLTSFPFAFFEAITDCKIENVSQRQHIAY